MRIEEVSQGDQPQPPQEKNQLEIEKNRPGSSEESEYAGQTEEKEGAKPKEGIKPSQSRPKQRLITDFLSPKTILGVELPRNGGDKKR